VALSSPGVPTSDLVKRELKDRFRSGGWYFVAAICSAGVFSALPFWHAAYRLQRPELRRLAVLYSVAGVAFLVLSGLIPTDATGKPIGSGAAAAENVLVAVALVVIIAACVQLRPLRREVFGTRAPRGPLSGDPAVARVLERRAKRKAARELLIKDPAMARELGIGRPDLHLGYDDGGLVDINTATAESLSQLCGIAPNRAGEIVAARQARGGTYFSIGEVLIDVALPPGEQETLQEHGIV
jgi:hypothetical protein